ncbi:sporulation initiation factor Spo0A C-terminal domain-containing protein [Paenibacillus amylolyticus]|uniref:sporulation initiation factor Spo0A C-terminal domain-containing protein n=1 Tax=Paenibacillus amylolyticus TaxID=1451 RepID=UPI003392B8B9
MELVKYLLVWVDGNCSMQKFIVQMEELQDISIQDLKTLVSILANNVELTKLSDSQFQIFKITPDGDVHSVGCTSAPVEKSVMAIDLKADKDPQIQPPFESELRNILHELGIAKHLKGYRYIVEALQEMNRDPKTTKNFTNVLYPLIAEQFKTTPSCVERTIRHAIETSWSNMNRVTTEKYQLYFSNVGKRPSNREFIVAIFDHISFEVGRLEQTSVNIKVIDERYSA